jgi:predicted dehydrogenase
LSDIRLISVLIAQDCLQNFISGSSWRADPSLSEGGHFMDTACHIVDQMLWISDFDPERVYAEMDKHGTDVDVVTAPSIGFTNGARATFAPTSLGAGSWREALTFYGTNRTMRIGRADGLSYQLRGGDQILPRAASAPDVRPIDDFVEIVSGRKAGPRTPPVC